MEDPDTYEPQKVWEDGEPCLTEALLKKWGVLPVPDWMRKPPKIKRNRGQRMLFSDEDG